jgi:hypothetical protein
MTRGRHLPKTDSDSNGGVREAMLTELPEDTDVVAVIAISIGQDCGKLAQMARNAEFHSLADLLARAQTEAELWVRACEDQ